jgi:hypothetical protein
MLEIATRRRAIEIDQPPLRLRNPVAPLMRRAHPCAMAGSGRSVDSSDGRSSRGVFDDDHVG